MGWLGQGHASLSLGRPGDVSDTELVHVVDAGLSRGGGTVRMQSAVAVGGKMACEGSWRFEGAERTLPSLKLGCMFSYASYRPPCALG